MSATAFQTIETMLADGCFSTSWIAHNSFVDEERRIFYVPTMKAACTAVKHFLRSLRTDTPVGFNPLTPEVSREMFIHDNAQMPYRNLRHFPPEKVREIVSAPGWFRFGIVRDPVERFFSAWRDNVFLCRPGNERFLQDSGQRYVEFDHFLDRVLTEDDPLTCDAHWRAQWAVLRPDEIAYTRLYGIDDLATMREDLGRRLHAMGAATEVPPVPRMNEGFQVPAEGFLNAAVTERLHRFYRIDYEAFGFPKRAVAPAPATPASAFTNQLTDTIFERHRVIAAHLYVANQAAG